LSGLDVTDNSKTGLYICGPRVGIGSVGPSPKGGGGAGSAPSKSATGAISSF